MTAATYATIKNAMLAQGLPASSGVGWTAADEGSYGIWAASQSYNAGIIHHRHLYDYGFPYPGEMPANVNTGAPAYSATLAAVLASGYTPLLATLTLTESYGVGSSFAWTFGDGGTATTTVNHTTHSYTVAGTYTPSVIVTVNGVAQPSINGNAITPTTYTATLVASPASGSAPLSSTLTLTESIGVGSSFAWTFGDGATATTSVNHTTHSYTVAGTYTPSVIVTAGGAAQPSIAGNSVTAS